MRPTSLYGPTVYPTLACAHSWSTQARQDGGRRLATSSPAPGSPSSQPRSGMMVPVRDPFRRVRIGLGALVAGARGRHRRISALRVRSPRRRLPDRHRPSPPSGSTRRTRWIPGARIFTIILILGGRWHGALHVLGRARGAHRGPHARPREEAQDGAGHRPHVRPRDRVWLGPGRAGGGTIPADAGRMWSWSTATPSRPSGVATRRCTVT